MTGSTGLRRIYWDSNILLSFIEARSDRIATIDALLADASAGRGIEIWTSTVSIAEVAFAESERTGKALDGRVQELIDDLWDDATVQLVEFNRVVGRDARRLVRDAMLRNVTTKTMKPPTLKPMDAVHLATALYLKADDFHTYDQDLLKQPRDLYPFPIQEPFTATPRLIP
jgi:predicted nucleic acid-binding protein